MLGVVVHCNISTHTHKHASAKAAVSGFQVERGQAGDIDSLDSLKFPVL